MYLGQDSEYPDCSLSRQRQNSMSDQVITSSDLVWFIIHSVILPFSTIMCLLMVVLLNRP